MNISLFGGVNPYFYAPLSGNTPENPTKESKEDERFGKEGCQTCSDRKYQDRSSDSSVSMQSPTRLSPETAAGAVMAHEQEHIHNDRVSAEQEGREVVSQSVRLHYDICRECGRSYVAGGSATTVSKGKSDNAENHDVLKLFGSGTANPKGEKGGLLDSAA